MCPNSTLFEPGILLTYSSVDDSPKIYSMRLDAVELITEDILYLKTNHDGETWFYIVISLALCIVIFLYIMVTHIKYNRMKYIRIKRRHGITSHALELFLSISWIGSLHHFSMQICYNSMDKHSFVCILLYFLWF